MDIILGIATLLGGIAAIWFFWDKITSWFPRWHRFKYPLVPRKYREFLLNRIKSLEPLISLDQPTSFRLKDVYLPLHTDWAEPERGQEMLGTRNKGKDPEGKKAQPTPRRLLADLVHHPRYRHFLVVGPPGSGKSTFLQHTGLTTIQKDPKRLPLTLPLKEFGDWLAGNPNGQLIHWAAHQHGKQDITAEGLAHHAGKGSHLWLLDGLDEIFDPKVRIKAAQMIGSWFAHEPGKNDRVILTTRPHALQQHGIMTALGWDDCQARVLDLEPKEQRDFLERWFRALHGGHPPEEILEELWNALEAQPLLADKRGNPLMLSTIAAIFHHGKKLPERRADLYEMAIEVLLRQRFITAAGGGDDRVYSLWRGLMEVAKGLMEKGKAKDISHPDFMNLLETGYFKNREVTDKDKRQLKRDAQDLTANTGLFTLATHPQPHYSFRHLGFQEYLAARKFALEREPMKELQSHLDDRAWKEVFLLTAGYLYGSGLPTHLGEDYLKGLLNSAGQGEGKCYRLSLALQASAEAPKRAIPSSLRQDLQKAGLDALQAAENKDQEEDRLALGLALGKLEDPRLGMEKENRWVEVKAARFQMGADELPAKFAFGEEKWCRPAHWVEITRDFRLGRFPVTNQEYAAFIEDGGYGKQKWWGQDGWQWLQGEKEKWPEEWRNEAFNQPNQPVVGVSWFEAMAYCRWLTAKWEKERPAWVPKDHVVRLPTEAEWELAARGTEGRLYPWGSEKPEEEHAIFNTRLGHTSPVGMYPRGATPSGILDLAGNVLEWCLDVWDEEAYQKRGDNVQDPVIKGRAEICALRGGAWGGLAPSLMAPVRYWNWAGLRYWYIGFRCCLAVPVEHGA